MSTETQTAEPDNSAESWADAGNDDGSPSVGVKELVKTAELDEAAPETDEQAQPDQEAVADAAAADPYGEPPEFWSKEKKALWATIAADARAAIHEHDKEARTNVSKRIEEASTLRKKAEAESAAAMKDRDDLAAWWKQKGPELAMSFKSKWDAVDWDRLVAENPAEFQRLNFQREKEAGLLSDAIQRHEAEVKKANDRAESAHKETRRAEHEKLAADLPEFFKPEVAQKTYDELGAYLVKEGVPADRIPNIYEASVVKIALKAMRFDKAQAQAKKVGAQPAPKTGGTVEVRPGARQAGPVSSVEKQAMDKLRNGGRLSREEGSKLFA